MAASEAPEKEAEKKGGDVDPRLVMAGAALAVLVVFPLGALALVFARWIAPRLRINPWWGIAVTVVLALGLAVFRGVPDVLGWPGQAFALLGDQGVVASWASAGIWPVLAGALVGFGWFLAVEWGEIQPPWTRWQSRRVQREIASRALVNGYVTVGLSRDDDRSRVVLPPSSTNTGTLVLGATGAGKTRGVISMLADAVAAGDPVVYVDLKGSSDVPMDLAGLAAKHGRPFWHFKLFDASTQPYVGPSQSGPASYNPAGYGDATRRKDLLIEALGSTNEYYANITANYTLTAFLVLQAAGRLEGRSAMAAILDVMEPNELLRAARAIPPDNSMRTRLVELVELEVRKASKDRDFASSLGSLRNYLALLMNSVAGPFIGSNGDVIDFAEVDRTGGIVVFSLSDMEYGKLAAQLGTLIIQDISTYIGVREGDASLKKHPFYLVVDEFSAFGRDNILGLLARGRSANVHTILATQNLADLARAGDGFRDQALGIVGSFVLFRGNTRADCEIMSGLTGKADEEVSGSTEEFVDWPEIQRLATGECVVVNNMAAPTDMPKTYRAGRLERTKVVLREIPDVVAHSVSLRVSNDEAGNWLAEIPIEGEVADFLNEMTSPTNGGPGEPALVTEPYVTSVEEPAEPVVPAPAPVTAATESTDLGRPPIAEVRTTPRPSEPFKGIMGGVLGGLAEKPDAGSPAAGDSARGEAAAPVEDTPEPGGEGRVVEPAPVLVADETHSASAVLQGELISPVGPDIDVSSLGRDEDRRLAPAPPPKRRRGSSGP